MVTLSFIYLRILFVRGAPTLLSVDIQQRHDICPGEARTELGTLARQCYHLSPRQVFPASRPLYPSASSKLPILTHSNLIMSPSDLKSNNGCPRLPIYIYVELPVTVIIPTNMTVQVVQHNKIKFPATCACDSIDFLLVPVFFFQVLLLSGLLARIKRHKRSTLCKVGDKLHLLLAIVLTDSYFF